LQLRSKERKDYRLLEMERFRDLLRMPINLHPKYMRQMGNCRLISLSRETTRHRRARTRACDHDRDLGRGQDIEDEVTLVAIATASD